MQQAAIVLREVLGFSNQESGPSLPVIQGAAPWTARPEAMRTKHFVGGVSSPLHNLLFNRIRRIESSGASSP